MIAQQQSAASKWHKDHRTIRFFFLAIAVSAVISFGTIHRHSQQIHNSNLEVDSSSSPIATLEDPCTEQDMKMGNKNCLTTSSIIGGSLSSKAGLIANVPNLASFAYPLFAEIMKNTEEPNVLISPFSIASALGLVLAGTTENSNGQNEIQSTLHVNSHMDVPALSQYILKSSLDKSEEEDPAVQLLSGNGIWSNQSIKPSYVDTAMNIHHATAAELPSTYEPINKFISDSTNGMITDMLSGDVDQDVVALLVNAVYFKGMWKAQFDTENTVKGVFHTEAGEEKEAMMMNMKKKMKAALNVAELGGASVVSLEYGAKKKTDDDAQQSKGKGKGVTNVGMVEEEEEPAEFGALFILPPENTSASMNNVFTSLSTLSQQQNKPVLQGIYDEQLSLETVQLTLPRFKVSYGTSSIKPHLKNMGIKSVFDQNEMLLGMSDDPKVYLDDMLHKAVMEVTEEGTVASAATVGVIMTRSIPPPPLEMMFDRPFGMVVLHLPTMTPLFIAKMGDPELMF
jgi:serine protease inhibitor